MSPTAIFVIAVTLQIAAMIADEGFHRRRGLPRWERIGHPLDTLSILACLGWLLVASPTSAIALPIYVALAIGSTLFVTKDEGIHARCCTTGEQWLHSMLFVLHPIVLTAFALVWRAGRTDLLVAQAIVATAIMTYQSVYWNVLRRPCAVDEVRSQFDAQRVSSS